MRILKEAKPGALERTENVVIGHYEKYAIVQDGFGNLFYVEGNENEVETGTYLEEKYIRSVSELKDAKKIIEIYG